MTKISFSTVATFLEFSLIVTDIHTWARFKRRILHVPNQILILVDSNEYVRLI